MVKESDLLFEASDVISMFPTLVWKVQLKRELHTAIDAKILAAIESMEREAPKLEPGHGWQSDQNLHHREEFQDLVACVDKVAKSALRFWRIGNNEIELTACWVNVLGKGVAHRLHNHPNNFLSGVYYVRTEPGADTINFHDPRNQTGIIRPPVVELTAENTDQVVVSVKNGTLLLFPAYLQHSVDANRSENKIFHRFAEERDRLPPGFSGRWLRTWAQSSKPWHRSRSGGNRLSTISGYPWSASAGKPAGATAA
jgi:uncharacterized protein (TIGR02466 family)